MPRLRCVLACLAPLVAAPQLAFAAEDRGSAVRVEWARLKTGSRYWNRHSERDVHVLRLMRSETSLEIADTWHAAQANSLPELTQHPFILAESIATLSDGEADNVAEYLRRGGFLLIDACVAVSINPDAQAYLEEQVQMLSRKLPDIRVAVIPPDHEMFSIYFKLAQRPPQTRSGSNPRWANGSTEPLRAVYLGDRMIAVISLSGFQCGLVQNANPGDVVRMVTNIYIYAMSR